MRPAAGPEQSLHCDERKKGSRIEEHDNRGKENYYEIYKNAGSR